MVFGESRLKDVYRQVVWGPYRQLCGVLPPGWEVRSNRLLGRGAHAFSRGKRKRLRTNLRRALPGTASFDAITRACFETHFAEQYISWSFERIEPSTAGAYLEIEGLDSLQELKNAGRGVVLVHPHMGAAQLPLCVLGHLGFDMHQVGGGGVAHEMSERGKACEAMRHRLEEGIPATIWDGQSYLRPLIRALESGAFVLTALDGTGGGRELGRRMTQKVCGQPMRLPVGSAWLALASGAALVPLHTHYSGGSGAPFRSVIGAEIPLDRSAPRKEALQSAAEALSLFMERVLTQHPGDWHFWDEFEPGRFLEGV
ncbi:MAG: hypothetical protein VXW32_04600 [Myxococcota bacterium]|nr:hypothetical protein [Myxococcota bacterium]